MPETIEELVKQAIAAAQEVGELPAFEVEDCGIERPADTDHGEWTSTVALRSARLAKMAPAKIAAAIVAHMPSHEAIDHVEVAGPGFINFYLSVAAVTDVFRKVREEGNDFARVDDRVMACTSITSLSLQNPTGPLHVGHGRWCALGDSMCNIFEHAGYVVDREYYITRLTAVRWMCLAAR